MTERTLNKKPPILWGMNPPKRIREVKTAADRAKFKTLKRATSCCAS